MHIVLPLALDWQTNSFEKGRNRVPCYAYSLLPFGFVAEMEALAK
jgi:hypothetical protein